MSDLQDIVEGLTDSQLAKWIEDVTHKTAMGGRATMETYVLTRPELFQEHVDLLPSREVRP